MTGAAELFKRY